MASLSAPWADVPSHEQFFVLITGANSGVGLAIGQRLIDDFLATRSFSSHLVLIPTTRTTKKSRETIESLRAHLVKAAQSQRTNKRAGLGSPQTAIDRVHILAVELDLCKLPSIYAAASKLAKGEIRDPTGVVAGGEPVSVPRIDVALFNAGYGGWLGVDWLGLARQFLAVGMVQATTFPWFKIPLPSNTLPEQEFSGAESRDKSQPQLAEVFTANLFGHYILAHELLSLFSRPSSSGQPPARIIWTSSIDAETHHLNFDDFQALQSQAPYESSKRITDLICVTSDLPSVKRASSSYFSSSSVSEKQTIKPQFYLSHPGVVCTALFPLNVVIFYGYYLAMYLSRLLGSPWHTVDSYTGACSAVWLAMATQEDLDAQNAQRIKWGSSSDRLGRDAPKKTEVEGWGWEGKIEDAEALRRDESQGILRKMTGRKWDCVELTEEKRIKFEEDAVRCWQKLEELRAEWEHAVRR
ncbi:hypothetical protein BJ170DRAFT_168017 [Xylariales sp. AK1849]|nr:hypothetical protein BJ170DRAFT_168017 [Xylariales sp. AK1849]